MSNHPTKVTKAQQAELDSLAEKGGGVLKPEAVVAFAKNPKTALHRRFTWDDGEAAAQFRLLEARNTIRVYVTVVENVKEPFRAFVSLQRDQQQGGGGYRRTVDVMQTADMREELLDMALADLERFQNRYKQLTELAAVFSAIAKVVKRRKRDA